ncbi:MAG TPA: alpha/beta hydrolase [Pseudomonadales bacterium]|nr:alpha/beta hydrolase [Pseudomonadales bacterium]
MIDVKKRSNSALLQPWQYTTSTGITLRGYETPITGKPIVHFTHGTGFNGMVYWPMLQHLLPHVDLVITNVQGHGESDIGKKFLGWETNASMIHEVLLHKRQQWQTSAPVIGMGHSFGAIVTLLVASHSPAVFDRLLLLDPIFLPPMLSVLSRFFRRTGLVEHAPMVKMTRKRRAHWPDRATARESLYQRGVFRDWHDDAFDAYLEYALYERADGVHLVTPPDLEADVFAGYAAGMSRVIRQLQQPCHMIRGDRTFAYVKTGLDRACRLNKRVTQETMTGGHCFMLQYPQAVAERLLQRLT